MVRLMVCLFFGLLLFALYRRRHVRVGLKIPGATFFLEAQDGTVEAPSSEEVNGRKALDKNNDETRI